MSQIRWKFKGLSCSYTTEQLEGAGWTYPQICQYGKPVYEASAPAWNGPEDGLPPVGLEVEVLWSSAKREYVTGKVLAHDEDRAVFRFISGERKGEYQADKSHSLHGADLPNFRPIRTPAQIAAEEQDTAVEQMFSKFGGPLGLTRLQCRWVISEGYRKVKDYGE